MIPFELVPGNGRPRRIVLLYGEHPVVGAHLDRLRQANKGVVGRPAYRSPEDYIETFLRDDWRME